MCDASRLCAVQGRLHRPRYANPMQNGCLGHTTPNLHPAHNQPKTRHGGAFSCTIAPERENGEGDGRAVPLNRCKEVALSAEAAMPASAAVPDAPSATDAPPKKKKKLSFPTAFTILFVITSLWWPRGSFPRARIRSWRICPIPLNSRSPSPTAKYAPFRQRKRRLWRTLSCRT